MNLVNLINFKGAHNVQNQSDNNTVDSNNKLKSYIKEALSSLAKDGERNIPENGKFHPRAVYLDVVGTQNNGRVAVEFNPKEPNAGRVLNVGVSRNRSDKITSRYLKEGTKNEILNYLKNEESTDEVQSCIKELSKKVDEQYK